jgi:hypothetical protein
MAVLYGRAGRLTAPNGGFRPGQLNFEGELSYSAHVELQGPSVQASGEISYVKTMEQGVQIKQDAEGHAKLTKIDDDTPLQQTVDNPTITYADSDMSAAVTLTLIPKITMTMEDILPFYAELTPWAKVEAADGSGGDSVGVSVGLGANSRGRHRHSVPPMNVLKYTYDHSCY